MRALARMEPALAGKKLGAQILLQVHDELVFEVAGDEVEKTLPVIRHVMEEAARPAVSPNQPSSAPPSLARRAPERYASLTLLCGPERPFTGED
jgi:hypothetical protein